MKQAKNISTKYVIITINLIKKSKSFRFKFIAKFSYPLPQDSLKIVMDVI